jgi:hypothetical protein
VEFTQIVQKKKYGNHIGWISSYLRPTQIRVLDMCRGKIGRGQQFLTFNTWQASKCQVAFKIILLLFSFFVVVSGGSVTVIFDSSKNLVNFFLQESRQFLSFCYQNPNKHPNMFVVSLLSILWRSKTRLQSFHLFFEFKPGLTAAFVCISCWKFALFAPFFFHNLHTATVAQIAETASKRVY